MPDSKNSSFIPKAGPVGRRRTNASKQVYIFTLISYVLIFATMIASAGTFMFKMSKEKLLNETHVRLYNNISIFNDASFQEVISFDRYLKQAKNRIDNSVSIVSIFDALEASTIDTVQIESLNLERELDEKIILSATIKTDSFDSTLFQREVYGTNQVIKNPLIEKLDTSGIDKSTTDGASDDEDVESRVSFDTTLEIPLLSIPYTGTDLSNSFTPSLTPNRIIIESPQPEAVINSNPNLENL